MRRKLTQLSPEQTQFVLDVQALWAEGRTQAQVAKAVGLSLSGLRARLAYYGYRMERLGRVSRIEPQDLTEVAA